jgi:hypothetical protein
LNLRPTALAADATKNEIEVARIVGAVFAISHRPVMTLPSALKVAVKRRENGSPSRQSFHSPSPMLIR